MRRDVPRAWRVLTAAVLAGACGGSGPASPAAPAPAPVTAPRPSIVLILADDLDLRSANQLPRLAALLGEPGVTFTNAFVSHPLCAPSRASILTGQYAHNHGVLLNGPPDGAFPAFRSREPSSIASVLRANGYRTGLLGKYMNGYPVGVPPEYVPPGWDEWQVHLTAWRDDRYFNYWCNENGRIEHYGASPQDYDTDVLARKAEAFIGASQAQPFFLMIAPQAPHHPAQYAERHAGLFPRAGAPSELPSFDEEDVSDKPAWVQNIPRLTAQQVRWLDEFQQARLRSMLAVEDLIERVIRALQAAGHADRTYVFFSSDNGLSLGEHRIANLKGNHYEESIRVPLLVRGPGLPRGRSVPQFALNIDLAPTFAELAGVTPPEWADGRSLVPLLRGSDPAPTWRSDFLVEGYSGGLDAALRGDGLLYAELDSGERELYDLRRDPYQVESRHRRTDPAQIAPLARRLQALVECRGASCRN